MGMSAIVFMDEYDKISSALNIISRDIKNLIADRGNYELCRKAACGIIDGAEFWVGKTSVGIPKNAVIQEAFQSFWESVLELMLDIENRKADYCEDVHPLADCAFQGKIYRFINTKNIKHNGIYVSWSKSDEFTPYMREKLGIRNTYLITAETGRDIGIDLEELGVSRPHEREVVFPTSKDTIVSIEKIKN